MAYGKLVRVSALPESMTQYSHFMTNGHEI